MDKRPIIQLISAIAYNANIKGFFETKIYKGDFKKFCVPGLHCYSCPGAVGSCPIGSLQAVISKRNFNFSFYVMGTILLFGILFGRLICGFLCPFGFFQDLLYKLPVRKIYVNPKVSNVLKYLKYVILVLFVLLFPIALTNQFGVGAPYFCQYICPAGTLQGGIPFVLLDKSLRGAVGFLFAWKFFILIIVAVLSIVLYRPFCRFLCPLGAMYSLFNPISFYTYKIGETCIGCKKCQQSCEMKIEVYKNPNSMECIRCGKCFSACKSGAMKKTFTGII